MNTVSKLYSHSFSCEVVCNGFNLLFLHELAEAAEYKEEVVAQRGVWRCAICTYDNDESMHVCDICGVIRHPVPGGNITVSKNTGTVSSFLQ